MGRSRACLPAALVWLLSATPHPRHTEAQSRPTDQHPLNLDEVCPAPPWRGPSRCPSYLKRDALPPARSHYLGPPQADLGRPSVRLSMRNPSSVNGSEPSPRAAQNGQDFGTVLTPLADRRARREYRPPPRENNFVMYSHELKGCDEMPALDPCGKFLISSVMDYEEDWHCGKTILAPVGYTLELEWLQFDLAFGDTLKIWDGCSNVKGERLILGEGTGYHTPTRIISEMECLYLEFSTDTRWQRGGFNASIKCNTPMPGGDLGPAGPDYSTEQCFNFVDNSGIQQLDCMRFMHPGVQCHGLRNIPYGAPVHSNRRWWPSVATYECHPGYEVCDGTQDYPHCKHGDSLRHCMPSKIYNGTTPECTGIICEEADKPEGARLRYRRGSDGAPDTWRQFPCFAEYACSPGFLVNTDWDPHATRRRRCNEEGGWDGAPPRCDPVACPEHAGPPGICVCSNGYDGVPEWDEVNEVWLHECHPDAYVPSLF